jgi:hypothetical protein
LVQDARLRSRLASGANRFVREHHDRRLVAGQLCQAYVRLLQGSKRWEQIAARSPRIGLLESGDRDEQIGAEDVSEYLEAGVHATA